jgi:hypothetical protein
MDRTAAGSRVLPAWSARVIVLVCAGVAALYVAGAAIVFATGPARLVLGDVVISLRNVPRLLFVAGASVAALLALSPRLRAVVRGTPGSAAGFFVGAGMIGAVLSFGPVIRTAGIDVVPGLYGWLYEYLPGFDGLRVPSRFALIVTLSLTVMGGYVLAVVETRRFGHAVVVAIGALFLVEAAVVPLPLNRSLDSNGLVPVTLAHLGARDAAIETAIRSLPDRAVLAEVPLGIPEFDVLAMYQSTRHWRLRERPGGLNRRTIRFAYHETHRNPRGVGRARGVRATRAGSRVGYPADTAAWIRGLWLGAAYGRRRRRPRMADPFAEVGHTTPLRHLALNAAILSAVAGLRRNTPPHRPRRPARAALQGVRASAVMKPACRSA